MCKRKEKSNTNVMLAHISHPLFRTGSQGHAPPQRILESVVQVVARLLLQSEVILDMPSTDSSLQPLLLQYPLSTRHSEEKIQI